MFTDYICLLVIFHLCHYQTVLCARCILGPLALLPWSRAHRLGTIPSTPVLWQNYRILVDGGRCLVSPPCVPVVLDTYQFWKLGTEMRTKGRNGAKERWEITCLMNAHGRP